MKRYLVFIPAILLFVGGAGFLIWAQDNNSRESYLNPMEYAPNFWFDSEEEYYPTSPLDFYYDGNLEEISGEGARQKYDNLSQEEKLENFKVFYKVDDYGSELVYQYWLFYVFNNASNEHYGDWESVFVFVNKNKENVDRIIASAHIGNKTKVIFANDEIFEPRSNNTTILVEKSSHANCMDGDMDGLFNRFSDSENKSSYCFLMFFTWSSTDKLHGLKVEHDSPYYDLRPISEIKDVFGEKYSEDRPLISKEKSPTLGMLPIKFGKKRVHLLPLGGSPPQNAWNKKEFKNPNEVLPLTPTRLANNIRGFFSGAGTMIAGLGAKIASPVTNLLAPLAKPLGLDFTGFAAGVADVENSVLEDDFSVDTSDSLLNTSEGEVGEGDFFEATGDAGGQDPVDATPQQSSGQADSPQANDLASDDETAEATEGNNYEDGSRNLEDVVLVVPDDIPDSELSEQIVPEQPQEPIEEIIEGPEVGPEEENSSEPGDTIPPSAPTISPQNNTTFNAASDTNSELSGNQMLFSGAAESNSIITIAEDPTYTAITTVAGSWSSEVTIQEGVNNFSITAKDFAGNISTAVPITINLDSVAPIGIISVANYAIDSSEFQIQWKSDAPDLSHYDVQYKIGVAGEWQDWTTNATSISENYTNAVTNTYYFRSRGVDVNQNIGEWQKIAVVIELSPVVVDIVINEIQIDDAEFVELYNPTSNSASLRGYYFSYYPSTRSEWNNPSRNRAFLEDAEIPAGGYYLIGVKDYPASGGNPNSDWDLGYLSGQLNNSNGTAAIFPFDPIIKTTAEARDGIIDAVGWGEVILSETSAAQTPPQGSSITRNQSHIDTENNASDFSITSNPTPKQNAVAEEESPQEEQDTTAPAAITGLGAAPGSARGTIILEWTSPGDDGNQGVATSYVVKYATGAITSGTWGTAQEYSQTLIPKGAGQQESLILENFTLGQTYYFALKAQDEVGNISVISNSPSSQASAVPIDFVISEVQLSEAEFVELYNPTSNAISLSGYYFSYYSSARTEWTNPYRNKAFPSGAQIPANGYYLIGLKDYPTSFGNPKADWQPYSSAQLNGSKGTIAIFPFDPVAAISSQYAYDNRADAVGWDNDFDGDGNDIFLYEQSPITIAFFAGESFARSTSHSDTNNNSSDFSAATSITPTNSSGEIYDPNLSFTPLWGMYQKDTRHSGLTTLAGPSWSNTSQATSAWIFSMDTGGSSQPVIDSLGVVYAMDGQGKVYAINSNGTQKWKFEPQVQGGDGAGWTDGSPALSSDSQYIYSTYATISNPYKLVLYSIKTADGSLNWKYSPSESGYNQSFTSPIVDTNGNIYVASKSRLYSISSLGTLNWEKILSPSDMNPNIRIPAIGDDGYIYVMAKVSNNAGDRYIWKINASNGAEVWKYNPTGNNALFNGVSINETGTIYTGGYLNVGTSGIFAVNPSDGSKIWSNNVGDASNVVPNFDAGGNIYIGTVGVMNSGAIKKIDSSGAIQWTFTPASPSSVRYPSVIDSQSRVYVGAMNKNVYALDSSNGAIVWQYALSGEAQGFAIGNGVVYVVTYDGKLYKLK